MVHNRITSVRIAPMFVPKVDVGERAVNCGKSLTLLIAHALNPFSTLAVLLLPVLYACTNPVRAHTINK